jgi:RNA polymerase sigma-70 factor (ECF subfamily)
MAGATGSVDDVLMGVMDDELAPRLAADLDGSFEALVHAHQDRLFTIALRLLGDPRDAEEVAQDAFVRAYRAIASYEPQRIRELRLRPWLAAIVVNLSRNRATRRRQPATVRLDDETADDADAGVRTPAATLAETNPSVQPDVAVGRAESIAHLGRLLLALPARYRAPVVLRHVDGLSFAEMSEALDRPEGTLKAQVHRGLAMLRAAHAASTEREELSA